MLKFHAGCKRFEAVTLKVAAFLGISVSNSLLFVF